MLGLRHLFLTQSLAAIAAAQTFVVDANNGPGTNFTTLTAAVAAAPDGATLIVRFGNYHGTVLVAGKGLTIVGEPGASIDAVMVFNTTPGQRFVLRGLPFFSTAAGFLQLQNCAGPVHIENCGVALFPLTPPPSSSLSALNCAQVYVTGSTFRTTTGFGASDVVLTNCSLAGGGGQSGLSQSGGATTLANCTVTGGLSFGQQLPAITVDTGVVRLLDGTSVGQSLTAAVHAIAGTGGVDVAPNVTLFGSTPVAPGIILATVDEATTLSGAALLGSSVNAELRGSANLLGGLMFGDPAMPTAIPGIGGELWLNPTGFFAVQSLGTPLTASLAVPNVASLRGQLFGWQGVTLGPIGVAFSNPAWFCIR